MIKAKDFFEGLNDERANEILETLSKGKRPDVTEAEYNEIIRQSTQIFGQITYDDVFEFEGESEMNRKLMHWVAGINTEAFLNIGED